MSEIIRPSHLKLASSVDDLPYPLFIEVPYDPVQIPRDRMMHRAPDYRTQKLMRTPIDLASDIHRAMRDIGTTAYFVRPDYGIVRCHFKTEMDQFIAAASVQPKTACQAPVVNFDPAVSPETVENVAERIHDLFNVKGGHAIKVTPHAPDLYIGVQAQSGPAFVKFFADLRRTDDALICAYR